MEFLDFFRTLSLGKQLNILFILSSLIICSILIVITKIQLDWLSDKIGNNTETIVNDRAVFQMKALGIIESKYVQSELSNYAQFITITKQLNEIFQNYSSDYSMNPFEKDSIHFHTEVKTKTFEYPTYYSKLLISSEGYELMYNESCFNKILPTMYITEYLSYYNGFYLDQLFFGYPGKIRKSVYTPLVREWFYKAVLNKNNLTFTEPYRDFTTNSWIISISNTLVTDENEVYGVTALDITLKVLTEKLSKKFETLASAYALLVSKGGIMINPQESWGISVDSTVRIYEEYITGINREKWDGIVRLDNETVFNFNFPGDDGVIEYSALIYKIVPLSTDQITHYLILYTETSKLIQGKAFANDVIFDTYNTLFYLILAAGLLIFIIISLSIYFVASSSGRKLKVIELQLKAILDRALFKGLVSKVKLSELDKKFSGIESLISLTKSKLINLKLKEKKTHQKKRKFTRPYDSLIYNDWNECLYPLNKYKTEKTGWKETLGVLENML